MKKVAPKRRTRKPIVNVAPTPRVVVRSRFWRMAASGVAVYAAAIGILVTQQWQGGGSPQTVQAMSAIITPFGFTLNEPSTSVRDFMSSSTVNTKVAVYREVLGDSALQMEPFQIEQYPMEEGDDGYTDVTATITPANINSAGLEVPDSSVVDTEVYGVSDTAVGTRSSMQIDPNGYPVIAFIEETYSPGLNSPGAALKNHRIQLLRCPNRECAGVEGRLIKPTPIDNDVDGVAVALQLVNGNPVIAYVTTSRSSGQLKLARCRNAVCSQMENNEVDRDLGAYDRSIALQIVSGKPVIAYTKSKKLKLAACSTDNCSGSTTITSIDSASDVHQLAMKVNTSNHPLIAYSFSGGLVWGLKTAACQTANCAGSPALVESILYDAQVDRGSTVSGPSIAITKRNIPMIGFTIAGKVYIAQCGGPTCVGSFLSLVGWNAAQVSPTDIAVTAAGDAQIVWVEGDETIQMAICPNGSCDRTGREGRPKAIVRGKFNAIWMSYLGHALQLVDDKPVIAYTTRGGSNHHLRVITCKTPTCSAAVNLTAKDAPQAGSSPNGRTPDELTLSFTPPLLADTTSTARLNITAPAGVSQGRHTITITARSSTGTPSAAQTKTIVIDVVKGKPAAPTNVRAEFDRHFGWVHLSWDYTPSDPNDYFPYYFARSKTSPVNMTADKLPYYKVSPITSSSYTGPNHGIDSGPFDPGARYYYRMTVRTNSQDSAPSKEVFVDIPTRLTANLDRLDFWTVKGVGALLSGRVKIQMSNGSPFRPSVSVVGNSPWLSVTYTPAPE